MTKPVAIGTLSTDKCAVSGVSRDDWPQIAALRDIGSLFYQRGWSVGTSSNYSVVTSRDPFQLLITASGKDKRQLNSQDFVVVNEMGKRIDPADPKPSAETLLHVMIAQQPHVGAVLHTHSLWCTLLSDLFADKEAIIIEGYEMLKGLVGVTTHQHRELVYLFENNQDMAALSQQIARRMTNHDRPIQHGFCLHRHGLYTWGGNLDEARRHVEIFEFLFEVLARRISIDPMNLQAVAP